MIIFYTSTIAHNGTVIKSSGYLGTNKALKYRDVNLYIVLNLEVLDGVQLAILIKLRLLKERHNRENL
jgi:hypothetical protein